MVTLGRGCHEIICCFNSCLCHPFKTCLESRGWQRGWQPLPVTLLTTSWGGGLLGHPGGAEVTGRSVLEPEARGPVPTGTP